MLLRFRAYAAGGREPRRFGAVIMPDVAGDNSRGRPGRRQTHPLVQGQLDDPHLLVRQPSSFESRFALRRRQSTSTQGLATSNIFSGVGPRRRTRPRGRPRLRRRRL